MSLTKKKPESGDVYSQFVHPLLSIASPFCMLVAVNLILHNVIGNPPVFKYWHYLIMLLVGIAKVILNNIFFKERVSPINALREFILVTALCYALFSLFSSGSLQDRFTPELTNLYPTFLMMLQWGLTFRLHRLFHNRELFKEVIRGKSGEKLVQELRGAAILANDAYSDMLRINRQLIIQGCGLFFVLGMTAVSGLQIDSATLFWLALFMLATFLSAAVVNRLKQEYIDLREGINAPLKTRRGRFNFAVLFLGCCILLALSFAAKESLLQLPQFPGKSSVEQAYQVNQPLTTPPPSSLDDPLDIEPLEFQWPPFLKKLMAFLAVLIKTFLVLTFIILLFLPFFSRNFRRWLKSKRFFRFLSHRLKVLAGYLKQVLQDFVDFIQSLFLRQKLRQAARETGGDEEQRNFRAAHLGLKKRLQTNKIIRLFVRLIHWGSKRGCRYYFSQTALDYIGQLSSRFPLLKLSLEQSVKLFEKALFSQYLLEHEEMQIYREHILKVIRSR